MGFWWSCAKKLVEKRPLSILHNFYIKKPWSNLSDFGPTAAEIKRAIADAFRAGGIEMPFPQREIRVIHGGGLAAVN